MSEPMHPYREFEPDPDTESVPDTADAAADAADDTAADTGRVVLTASSSEDLLAVVPYRMGFHPTESLVAIQVSRGRRRLGFTVRVDLPTAEDAPSVADQVCAALRRNDVDDVVLVAYTAARARAELLVERVFERLEHDDVGVVQALRADGQRWFSYVCEGPCCPAEGTAYDTSCHPLAAAAVMEGVVALPDRASLESSVAPVRGIAAMSMKHATARAEEALLADATPAPPPQDLLVRLQGRMHAIVSGYLDDPRRLTDDEIAEAAVIADCVPVRDVAWTMMSRAAAERHLGLWRQILRRVVPPYEPAVGSLTAFAAWLHGDGALAGCALDRVLAADPDYSMAKLIDASLRMALPPSTWEEHRPAAG